LEGKWQAIEWQQAFELVTAKLQETIAEFGADKVGVLASPNATLEEFYLLQKITRGLGSPHIDHRLREVDMQDQADMPLFPGLEMPVTELQTCDAIVLIGSNLQKEQPLAALQVRKAALKGAAILAINSMDYRFNFKTTAKKIVAPHLIPVALASVINAIHPVFDGIEVDETAKTIAQHLQGKQKICILLGAQSFHHAEASLVRFLAKKLATLTGSQLGLMTSGANTAGAWLAGAVPHRQAAGALINHVGLDAYAMLHKLRKAYLLWNVEPELDCAHAALTIEALKQAKLVVAFSLYRQAALEDYADIILPIAPFTETSGTFVNVSGEWQTFQGVAKPFALSRPGWKVLRVLGNFLNLDGFNYESSEEIAQEVKKLVASAQPLSSPTAAYQVSSLSQKKQLTRLGEIPIYAIDSLVRRSEALQKTQTVMEGDVNAVRLHPKTAGDLGVQAGDRVRVRQSQSEIIELAVLLDTRVAIDAVWIAGGIAATSGLGELFGEIEIQKVSR
ncbi:MAG: molybdopterin-dependent oxidoreductase, partial [Gammaproteobacteria bacterium]|nr:molybdopterin-dependent oxidoreductase [Gammaproteobacteria bacterium]